ncbi:MAG: hypothetical protein KJ732_03685 [Candidatus Margulisbacteria bacterium]|nr:hypothetical protein [Candidatus Margulisiibacteriota bacterium]
MTVIGTFTQYRQLGSRLLQQYGTDTNNDEQISQEEVNPQHQERFSQIASRDGDSATISYRDVLAEANHSIAPQLEESLQAMAADPGRYYATDPFVGTLAARSSAFASFIRSNPQYGAFFRDLYEGAHSNSISAVMTMIPSQYAEQASALADPHLQALLTSVGRSPEQAFSFGTGFQAGVTFIYDVENDCNTWNLHVYLDSDGARTEFAGGEYVVPWQNCGIHELGHVARTQRLSPEDIPFEQEAAEELANVCEQIILQDNIMRNILNLSPDTTVAYPLGIATEREAIPLGNFAIMMRGLVALYGNIESALMSQEFQAFLGQHYSASDGEEVQEESAGSNASLSRGGLESTPRPLQHTLSTSL